MAPQQVPVTIITGFLGSGKTTLIKRLLSAPHGLRIGLVLNEIGQAGIDQVPEADRAYVELTDGCACCIRNPDLIAALEEIAKQPGLDRILIETSGLADPLPLTWTMTRPELVDLLRMDAVVATVDTTQLEQASTEEWKNQVRCADLVVLTKEHLPGAGSNEHAASLVHDLNPPARFVSSRQMTLPELLLDFTLPSHAVTHPFERWPFRLPRRLHRRRAELRFRPFRGLAGSATRAGVSRQGDPSRRG